MDSVAEIKARLPIEELVRQYTQITRKGRNFVALCPFHRDTRPSLLVSPDKGIAYCFPCQKGGDIFSFYQAVEGVDFRTALKDLAEKAGVTLADVPVRPEAKDERERMRMCLESASRFYRKQLAEAPAVIEYIRSRGVADKEIEEFEIGYAPDSFSATYEYLLKEGFSRKEIVGCGLGIQKDLQDQRIFDRFRNRVIFPIHDPQGKLIGFGGRTLSKDSSDAKYMNTSDGPLYHKSSVLYALHRAKEAVRQTRSLILVEGYFDVLACHRAGFLHTVATCGTALTEDHVRLLKRYADTVILCLDQDRAGREAAERAFLLLAREGITVQAIVLDKKDPADVALENAELLRATLSAQGKAYVDIVAEEITRLDIASAPVRRAILQRLLALLDAQSLSVERARCLQIFASALRTTESALESDVRAFHAKEGIARTPIVSKDAPGEMFSGAELTIGILLMHPTYRPLISGLLPPEDAFASALYTALKSAPPQATLEDLPLSSEVRERAKVLYLYCEEHGFAAWSDSLVAREIRRNCANANRTLLRLKQQEITKKMLSARAEGKKEEEDLLREEYQKLISLTKTSVETESEIHQKVVL